MQCLWWKVRGLKNKVNVEEASFHSYVHGEGGNVSFNIYRGRFRGGSGIIEPTYENFIFMGNFNPCPA